METYNYLGALSKLLSRNPTRYIAIKTYVYLVIANTDKLPLLIIRKSKRAIETHVYLGILGAVEISISEPSRTLYLGKDSHTKVKVEHARSDQRIHGTLAKSYFIAQLYNNNNNEVHSGVHKYSLYYIADSRNYYEGNNITSWDGGEKEGLFIRATRRGREAYPAAEVHDG